MPAFKSPFTASWWQVSTYLFGVALFSISFLVFLNSSVSFVVTNLIGEKKNVGDAVGTLGFADELVALVACPLWGLISDRLGVRWVCTIGYTIVGLSLFLFVQATNVYPQLLLARLFFSVGGAATATMVTAVLPAMTSKSHELERLGSSGTERTVTEESHAAEFGARSADNAATRSGTSQVAGFVGMFTGMGALVALSLFLPLPTRFEKSGLSRAQAVVNSFYVVGLIAFLVAAACFFGLRKLPGEEDKGWKNLMGRNNDGAVRRVRNNSTTYFNLFLDAVKLGFANAEIALGYIGGFVARASSVGISLFIALYVDHYFISTGKCKDQKAGDPSTIKESCRDAYLLASALAGAAETFALVFAPIFGYLEGRYGRYNIPLAVAAIAGIAGYILFAQLPSPEFKSDEGSPAIFGVMALIGISQIGSIVCSLSVLSRGIQGHSERVDHEVNGNGEGAHETTEAQPLLAQPQAGVVTKEHLKGSIAGVYSFGGGAGILLLTKLGGSLFDSLSPGAPFYMMAIFNGILLVAAALNAVVRSSSRRKTD